MFLADVGLSQKVIKLSLLVVFAAGGPAQDGDCVADPGEGWGARRHHLEHRSHHRPHRQGDGQDQEEPYSKVSMNMNTQVTCK